ncbi:hypothetical protein ORI89_05110 [Sphingobacterium sp. UT-1RO-CII-1]|uniref:hypothetical protein n=1 Tax=Sphingobacterium sp. UT-1RO-CII-1 TaxID=2995225 RepID=UPI00227C1084|nr:hypothetical protein [Sphingobacterium sp. UT-1RO-CII-1]MCY4779017.1 hypothetical protein [Sphingobacterium sp. UT-1RO-CII-1]
MEKKSILVNYPKSSSTPVKVVYRVSQEDSFQTIECAVATGQSFPEWLQLKKFDFVSMKSKGVYDLLFEETKYNKNLDTVLFLDQVYAEIMKTNKYPVN